MSEQTEQQHREVGSALIEDIFDEMANMETDNELFDRVVALEKMLADFSDVWKLERVVKRLIDIRDLLSIKNVILDALSDVADEVVWNGTAGHGQTYNKVWNAACDADTPTKILPILFECKEFLCDFDAHMRW